MRCQNSGLPKTGVALVFALATFYSNAQGLDRKPAFLDQLNAKAVLDVIEPLRIDGNVSTPFAVRYTKNGDMMPSCILVDSADPTHPLEMISPSDGQFANCHQKLNIPTILKIDGDYFAVYSYVIEDPRAVFENSYQVVKLNDHGYRTCRADEQINSLVSRRSAGGVTLKKAVNDAIRRFGCAL